MAILSPDTCPRIDKNSIVKGTVKSIDAKGAIIALEGDVEGYLRASEVARDRVEDIRTHLKEGDPGYCDDHQHRSQESYDQSVYQGARHGGRIGGHAKDRV